MGHNNDVFGLLSSCQRRLNKVSNQFKALILNQEGENFTREIKSIEKNFLKDGNVTVKVHYSGLNYKDALILKNGARLVKEFPHIPGIDFSGIVEEIL